MNAVRSLKMTHFDLRCAASLWRKGFGTADIALRLGLREAIIWNHMDTIRKYAKHGICSESDRSAAE
jgi:DNA-binding CsgD family transcriptional regulator